MLDKETVMVSASSRDDGVHRAVTARRVRPATKIERDDEQRIRADDWTPGGVACVDLPPDVRPAESTETADPSGPMGGAMSVTRTALAPFGGTPPVPAAIPVRSGAGCRRRRGPAFPQHPDPSV